MINSLILLALVLLALFSVTFAIVGLVLFFNYVRWERKNYTLTIKRKTSKICYA